MKENLPLKQEKMGKQANGAVMARYADTMVFAAATMEEDKSDKDFFPLNC